MSWTAPTLVEVCIGLEINGYLPPEFLISPRPRLAAGRTIAIVLGSALVIRAIACGRTSGNR
jgi:coenzyme PQQ precursor peptide PqqA